MCISVWSSLPGYEFKLQGAAARFGASQHSHDYYVSKTNAGESGFEERNKLF